MLASGCTGMFHTQGACIELIIQCVQRRRFGASLMPPPLKYPPPFFFFFLHQLQVAQSTTSIHTLFFLYCFLHGITHSAPKQCQGRFWSYFQPTATCVYCSNVVEFTWQQLERGSQRGRALGVQRAGKDGKAKEVGSVCVVVVGMGGRIGDRGRIGGAAGFGAKLCSGTDNDCQTA